MNCKAFFLNFIKNFRNSIQVIPKKIVICFVICISFLFLTKEVLTFRIKIPFSKKSQKYKFILKKNMSTNKSCKFYKL